MINTGVEQDSTLPGHEWRWMIRLNGADLRIAPCPSDDLDHPRTLAATPCLDEFEGLWVIVDAFSGQILGTTH